MKKLFAALIAAIAIFTTLSPAAADSFDAWVPDVSNIGQGKTSFFIAEDTQGNNLSVRTGGREVLNNGSDTWWCDSFTSSNKPSCDLKDSSAWYNAYVVLPNCKSAAQENCIESLSLTLPGKDPVEASYVRNIAGITFAPMESVGLYESSTISLWSAPNAPSAGGLTDYAVNVRTQMAYNQDTQKFETIGMTSIVMPYRTVQGSRYMTPKAETIQNSKGTTNLGVGINGIAQECVFNEAGLCGIMQNFTSGTIAKLTSRISNEVGGWFKGRLQKPNIAVSKFSSKNNKITVEAQAVTVARLQTAVSKDQAPAGIQDIFVRSGVMGAIWSGQPAMTDSQGEMAFTYLNTFRNFAKETSAATSTLWSFGTVSAGRGSSCLADTSKVLGIVTTNATVYDGEAPAFANGQINYTVGGLHFMPDGVTPVSGTYDLVMRSESARCLYGFSSAPISASINVVDSSGEASTAVTSFTEKDGWMHFAANGFHFSTPQIKVKLTQSKKKTITCINVKKPSLKKTVTALKPTCPSGYRLKK